MNNPRKNMKSRWSIKYKKSINCNHPKGFSQKNYCKRQSRGGKYMEGFRSWLNENLNSEIVFHNTSIENLKKIEQHGLKINSEPYYTIGSNDWVKRAYGMIPIFASTQKDHYHEAGDVQLTIDIKGLKKAADLGSLIDFGAYIDEKGFYFEDNAKVPEEFKKEEIHYSELYYGSFVEDFIQLTKTLVVMENIHPGRIIKIQKLS